MTTDFKTTRELIRNGFKQITKKEAAELKDQIILCYNVLYQTAKFYESQDPNCPSHFETNQPVDLVEYYVATM